MFRWQQKVTKVDNTASIHLYRQCMRIIKQLIPTHQKIWYDYTRLKFQENADCRDPVKLQKLIKDAKEELEWTESLVKRKSPN
jgi:hypothetical protein